MYLEALQRLLDVDANVLLCQGARAVGVVKVEQPLVLLDSASTWVRDSGHTCDSPAQPRVGCGRRLHYGHNATLVLQCLFTAHKTAAPSSRASPPAFSAGPCWLSGQCPGAHLRKSATSSKFGRVAERPTMRVISWVDSTWWVGGEQVAAVWADAH